MNCLRCSAAIPAHDNYCGQCGAKKPTHRDLRMRKIAADVFEKEFAKRDQKLLVDDSVRTFNSRIKQTGVTVALIVLVAGIFGFDRYKNALEDIRVAKTEAINHIQEQSSSDLRSMQDELAEKKESVRKKYRAIDADLEELQTSVQSRYANYNRVIAQDNDSIIRPALAPAPSTFADISRLTIVSSDTPTLLTSYQSSYQLTGSSSVVDLQQFQSQMKMQIQMKQACDFGVAAHLIAQPSDLVPQPGTTLTNASISDTSCSRELTQ